MITLAGGPCKDDLVFICDFLTFSWSHNQKWTWISLIIKLTSRLSGSVFYFKNGYKKEFQDKNSKSCSWFTNKVLPKNQFYSRWDSRVPSDSLGVKIYAKTVWGYFELAFRNLYHYFLLSKKATLCNLTTVKVARDLFGDWFDLAKMANLTLSKIEADSTPQIRLYQSLLPIPK